MPSATGGKGGNASTGNVQIGNGNSVAIGLPSLGWGQVPGPVGGLVQTPGGQGPQGPPQGGGQQCGCGPEPQPGPKPPEPGVSSTGGNTSASSGDAYGGDGGNANATGGNASAGNQSITGQLNTLGGSLLG